MPGQPSIPSRRQQAAIAASAVMASLVAVAVLAGIPTARPAAPPAAPRGPVPATSSLPTLRLRFDAADWRQMFATRDADDGKNYVPIGFTDEHGQTSRAKAALRGFSSWHHGCTKPSLRLKPSTRHPGQPEHFELQRPEDLLALANAIPDELAATLGLLHAGNEPVRVFLDDRFAGVYLRSLRPGPDLARAGGRPRGTFCKGDNLGDRRQLDLWHSASAWRLLGEDQERAAACLDDLLATLREPPSAARCERLWQLLDFEATAKVAALAVVVGSIHADRAHNQLLFFAPARGRCEPLLWDANGFGIHGDPDVPVDVARHPLAQACLCDPRFLHRRDQLVARLLQNGDVQERIARHVARVTADLRADPEPGRVVVRGADWWFAVVEELDVARAVDEIQTWFRARERHLRAWLADARLAVAVDPADATRTVVQVFGNVGIAVSRRDGAPPRSVDGHDATLLLPGRSLREHDLPQRRDQRGRGVPAPHPRPAPSSYTLVGRPDELQFTNAITGDVVAPTAAPPPEPVRTTHPWSFVDPAPRDVVLGPGSVDVTTTLVVPSSGRLLIQPGTDIRLAAGVGIVCAGEVTMVGTATAPIELVPADSEPWGAVAIAGAARVRIAHTTMRGGGAMTFGHRQFTGMLTLHDASDVELELVRLHDAHGAAIAMLQSTATITGGQVGPSFDDGITLERSRLTAVATRVAFCRGHGVFADGGQAVLRGCTLVGNATDSAIAYGGEITRMAIPEPAATPR
ncbi:MAG: CotH kinase family protein [Planctomycetes bacterium]|nr:CotH kinase family protein [Planctomycetota bacterium]